MTRHRTQISTTLLKPFFEFGEYDSRKTGHFSYIHDFLVFQKINQHQKGRENKVKEKKLTSTSSFGSPFSAN